MFFFITGGNSDTGKWKQKINQSLEDYKIYKKKSHYLSNQIEYLIQECITQQTSIILITRLLFGSFNCV